MISELIPTLDACPTGARHLLFLVKYQITIGRVLFSWDGLPSWTVYAKSFLPSWLITAMLSVGIVDLTSYVLQMTSLIMQILLITGAVACPSVPVLKIDIYNISSAYDTSMHISPPSPTPAPSPSSSSSLSGTQVYTDDIWYKCDYPLLNTPGSESADIVFGRRGWIPGYRFTNEKSLRVIGALHFFFTFFYFLFWIIVEGPINLIEQQAFTPNTKESNSKKAKKDNDGTDENEECVLHSCQSRGRIMMRYLPATCTNSHAYLHEPPHSRRR